MTPLRQQYIRELVLRGTATRTQESYVAAVHGLAKHYHLSPEQVSDEQLKEYLFYLAQEKEYAARSLNIVVSALRSFYRLVLKRSVDQLRLVIPRVQRAIRRPQVFAEEELERLFTM